MTESSSHPKIEILTYSEVEEVKGFAGNFEVQIRKRARSVDPAKCTGCGDCLQKCPVKVPSEFDLGLRKRGAIYIPFPQAVPKVPVIDREHCTYFRKGKCKLCAQVCQAQAIDYEQKDEVYARRYGAIVVATGFTQFDPAAYGEYGGGKFKNVITGLHLERMLDSSGPTGGKVIRPSDGKPAKTIVFLQCTGSRDEAKGVSYCSRICCMYTAKHALLVREHDPEAQAFVFYIDIRAGGKGYEEFVNRVQREHGAVYLRGRVSRIYEEGDKLVVAGVDTLAGEQVRIEADLVVLASAMVPQTDAKQVAQILNIPYDQYGFFSEAHPKLQPVESVTKGIFLTGACQFPKDIPDTITSTGAAAVQVCNIFSHDEMEIEPKISVVREDLCSGCWNCLSVCPFSAIEKAESGGRPVARVIATLCSGCGNCASACRTKSIEIKGFTDNQIYAQIEAAFAREEKTEDADTPSA